jgi:5-methylcytosine-specific restriction protein A
MPSSRPTAKPLGQSRTKDGKTMAQAIRSTPAWRKVRGEVLADSPLCWLCVQNDRTTIAKQVHHIRQLVSTPSLAFDRSNLVGLCRPCHDCITGMEKAGRIDDAVELFDDFEPSETGQEIGLV